MLILGVALVIATRNRLRNDAYNRLADGGMIDRSNSPFPACDDPNFWKQFGEFFGHRDPTYLHVRGWTHHGKLNKVYNDLAWISTEHFREVTISGVPPQPDAGLRWPQYCPSLESLVLHYCDLIDTDLAALPIARHLKRLTIADSFRLTCAGIKGMPNYPNLSELELDRTGFEITDVDVFHARYPALQRVMFNATGGRMIAKIDADPATSEWKTLSLAKAGVTDVTLTQLPAWPHLQTFHLTRISMTRSGFASLARLPALHTLRIESDTLTDTDVVDLAKFPALQSVELIGSQFTDATADTLARMPNLRHVRIQQMSICPKVWSDYARRELL